MATRRRIQASAAATGTICLLALGGLTCRQIDRSNPQGGTPMSGKTIEQVLDENVDRWMAIPGVAGVAIGQDVGKPCLLILAETESEQIQKKIPSTIDGYPVRIRHSGEIRALDKP